MARLLGEETFANSTHSHLLKIVLNEVWVVELRETVVVTVVVLDVPSLWHHPVEPVSESVPEGSHGELETVPATLVRVDLIVTTVAGVVSDHSPTGEGPRREGDDGDEGYAVAHGGDAHEGAEVRPEHDLVKVGDVGGALVFLEGLRAERS